MLKGQQEHKEQLVAVVLQELREQLEVMEHKELPVEVVLQEHRGREEVQVLKEFKEKAEE